MIQTQDSAENEMNSAISKAQNEDKKLRTRKTGEQLDATQNYKTNNWKDNQNAASQWLNSVEHPTKTRLKTKTQLC